MGIANALPSNTTFRHSGLSYGTGGTLDLNGYDQTIASLYTDSNLANAVGSTITSATAATLTVNQAANTTYYGTFSGVVGLTKTGTGTLTLGGNSTYDTSNTSTGLTTVTDGVLAMNKQNGTLAISGDILINGGRLSWSTSHQVADTSSITVDSGVLWVGQSETVANVTINSAPTVSGYSFHLLNGLNVTGTLTVAAGDAIAGSGGSATANAVNMTGGRLAMAANGGNSTITIGSGGLTMSGATVQLGYDGESSTAQVNLGGDFTGSGTNNISYVNTSGPRLLDLGGATRTFNVTSGTTTINPTIQNGALTKTGSGTLVLSGAIPNTYTGLTTVDGGTLTLNKTSGVNAVAGDIVVNSGTLFLNNHHQIADTASIVVNGSANFNNNQRTETVANVTLNSSYSDPNNHRVSNMTISGALTITDGVVGLNSGTNTTVGTLDMSGGSRMDFAANTGSTILNVGSGGLTMDGATLRLGWSGLGSPYTAQVNLDGDFTGSGTNSLTYLTTNGSRLLNLQGATRTFDVTGGTTTVDLTIQNGGLTKIGDGTLLLNAVNTYTGTTTVSAGTLGGDGSIAGAVLVEGTGLLSPGNSPGILTLNDGLTFTGGTYEVDIEGTTAGTGYDQVVVTSGNVDLGLGVADLLLNVDSGFSPAIDDYLWIIDNTGSGTTSGYFTGLDDGSFVDVNGRRFYVYYNADHDTAGLLGGNDVLLTSVPEPSTLAMLLGLAGIGLMGWMRRRR